MKLCWLHKANLVGICNFHQIFADILRNCNENVREFYPHGYYPLKWVTNSTIGQHCFGKINCGVFMNFASILDKQSHGCEKFHEWMCIIMKLIRDQWTDNLKSNEKVCSISKRFLQISTLNQLESEYDKYNANTIWSKDIELSKWTILHFYFER